MVFSSFSASASKTKLSRSAVKRLAAALTAQPVAQEPVANDPHRFAVVHSDYSRPFLLGAYPTLGNAVKAQCGSPEKWHIFERHLAHPATPAPVEAGLIRDAARYRWLRERDVDAIDKGGVFAGMTPQNVVLSLEDLDAAVDAARAQSAPVGEKPVAPDQACACCGYFFNDINPCKCGQRLPFLHDAMLGKFDRKDGPPRFNALYDRLESLGRYAQRLRFNTALSAGRLPEEIDAYLGERREMRP